MKTHTYTHTDRQPRMRQLVGSSSGTDFPPQHLACHKEKKSRTRAGSLVPLGELKSTGSDEKKIHTLQTGTALINGRNPVKNNTAVETQPEFMLNIESYFL